MAVLYNKPYRRGGGRRGGYLKASPDPVAPADFPSDLTLPATSQPSYLGTVADPWNPVMTVQRITDNGGNFPTTSSNYIGLEYSERPIESGRYVVVRPWTYRIIDRGNGYAYVNTFASTGQAGSRRYPGRFYGEYNSQTQWGYDDTYYDGNGRTIVFDGGATYSYVGWGEGEGVLPYNEDYVALVCRRSSDNVYEIKCVRVSDGAVQGTWVTGVTALTNIDNCSMSAHGNYVIVQLIGTVDGRTAGLHVFDRSMTHQRQISIGGLGAHIDYGLLEDGQTEVAAWVSSVNKAVEYYTLSDGVQNVVIAAASSPFGYNSHMSMRALDRPGYLTISHFDNSGISQTTLANGSVCQVRLATGEIELWGSVQMHEDTVARYHHSAFACPSFDGKRMYWNSAWRDSTSTTNALLYVTTRER